MRLSDNHCLHDGLIQPQTSSGGFGNLDTFVCFCPCKLAAAVLWDSCDKPCVGWIDLGVGCRLKVFIFCCLCLIVVVG